MLLNSVEAFFGDNPQPYLIKLYRAILCAAYYGLLRIGELTYSNHVIKAKDVHISTNKNKVFFVLHSSKTHAKFARPQTMKITQSTQSTRSDARYSPRLNCPFQILKDYLQVQGKYTSDLEQFFVFSDSSAVKPAQLRNMLKKPIEFNHLDAGCYSVHAMRTGRASDLLAAGVPVDTIKKLGRWKSSAIFRYL